MPIKLINESTWDDIVRIQKEAYTDIALEEVSVLKNKWHSSPQTCAVYEDRKGNVLAYLLAHPWPSEIPPKLNEKVPVTHSEMLFIHDLALATEARGKNVGRKMVQSLIDSVRAQGFLKVLLVSVQNTAGFWEKFGFVHLTNENMCASYGENAQLMMLDLVTQ